MGSSRPAFNIDWQAEGIEVLGEAEDGEEALKSIELQTPDIIITDIKMPWMDGLALIETVKNRNLPTKIIIISGYSDFSSELKALRCGHPTTCSNQLRKRKSWKLYADASFKSSMSMKIITKSSNVGMYPGKLAFGPTALSCDFGIGVLCGIG
jgi:DNA-binding NarL/FixJ family response regulator